MKRLVSDKISKKHDCPVEDINATIIRLTLLAEQQRAVHHECHSCVREEMFAALGAKLSQ
jgi:hypothetical protein